MTLERKKQPLLSPLSAPEFIRAKKIKLANDIPVLILNDESLKLIRLEIRLQAGSIHQKKAGQAMLTAKMLTEGTSLYTGEQISEILDFHGVYISTSSERETTTVSVHFPLQAIEPVFKFVENMLTDAVFPEDKLEIVKNKQAQSLAINLEKTSFVAFRTFIETIYGKNHPYGSILTLGNIERITRNDLEDFYRKNYRPENIHVFIAGNIDKQTEEVLNQTIGSIKNNFPKEETNLDFSNIFNPQEKFIKKSSALQSSICIGREIFNKKSRNWIKLNLLNMVLGGYFGSRLMSEIREHSGLAYGIFSSVRSYQHSGLFYISADVNAEKTSQALTEVYKVLRVLCRKQIPEEELNLVKNYMIGRTLRQFDGLFSLLDRYIEVEEYDFTIDYWTDFINTIKHTSSEELLILASVYLLPENMTEITVGKRDV